MTNLSPESGESKRAVKSLSPFCAGLEWTKGSLNDSTYRAFTKFAGSLFNRCPPHVLKEVAGLIEAAGDSIDKSKLIEQFSSAFAFVANERAAEALGAQKLKSQHIAGSRSEGKWPKVELGLVESIARDHADYTLERWRMVSPRYASSSRDVLPALFPSGSLVCFGPRADVHFVRRLDDTLLDGIAPSLQFVVPNPASAPFIVLPSGKRSVKCDENFPLRRFVVVEFERKFIDPEGKRSLAQLLDLQSVLHAHVAKRTGALALLAYSGNKSLHAWHHCESWSEEKVVELLRYVCRLGGDHSFSSPSQFTRMPGGVHANGSRQSIHYFKAPYAPALSGQ